MHYCDAIVNIIIGSIATVDSLAIFLLAIKEYAREQYESINMHKTLSLLVRSTTKSDKQKMRYIHIYLCVLHYEQSNVEQSLKMFLKPAKILTIATY